MGVERQVGGVEMTGPGMEAIYEEEPSDPLSEIGCNKKHCDCPSK